MNRAPVPKHVQACMHSGNPFMQWFLWFWCRSSPHQQKRIPYRCNSWRCEGCRRHVASVLFARLNEALSGIDEKGWCFFVLTLDQKGYFPQDKPPEWTTHADAFAKLSNMTTRFLGRLGRRWGAYQKTSRRKDGTLRVETMLGNRWVAVVEQHKTGWPHVNLMVWCPKLAAQLRAEHESRRDDPEIADAVELARAAWRNKEPITHAIREKARLATLLGDDLLKCATDSDWGRQSTGEAARDAQAVAGYIVKLVGEVAKTTQAPLQAPVRFRRLRCGRGFLPEAHKGSGDVTGCLVRRERSAEGDWQILPVNPPKDPAQAPAIEAAKRAEFQAIEEEESILSRRRVLPAMPPIRRAVAGKLEPHSVTSARLWAAELERAAAA